MNTNSTYKSILRVTSFVLSFSSIFLMQSIFGITPPSVPVPVYDPARIKERAITEDNPWGMTAIQEELKKKEAVTTKSQEIVVNTKFKLNDVVITGVTIYNKEQLVKLYKSYLNKNVSLADIQKIADAITERYHQDGYTMLKAYVVQKDTTPEKGIAQIKVKEEEWPNN